MAFAATLGGHALIGACSDPFSFESHRGAEPSDPGGGGTSGSGGTTGASGTAGTAGTAGTGWTHVDACGAGTFDHDGEPDTACVAFTDCAPGQSVARAGSPTEDRTCDDCPSGTFTTMTNAPTCAQWTTCAAGTRVANEPSPSADRVCAACPEGTFSTHQNTASCTAWKSCTAGSYVSSPPSTIADRACEDCQGGTYTTEPNEPACHPWRCTPNQPTCDGNTATICNAVGSSYATSGTACESDVCVGGVCERRSCLGLEATCGSGRNRSCCESLLVPGGTYNRSNDKDYPATVSSFRLDTYEITVGRFRRFVAAYKPDMLAAGAGKNPNNPADSGWDKAWDASLPAGPAALQSAVQCNATYQTWTPSAGPNENRPMNCLSWYEAAAFCIWDGGRLPTEAEWNYAAAGGIEQRKYPWGAAEPGADAKLAVYGCYYSGDSSCAAADLPPVGSVAAGHGRWGQADLAGSVWEWVQDWYGPYLTSCENCAGPSGLSSRGARGGGFGSLAAGIPSSYRSQGGPSLRHDSLGARCVRNR